MWHKEHQIIINVMLMMKLIEAKIELMMSHSCSSPEARMCEVNNSL
jgi:hypothetical protein